MDYAAPTPRRNGLLRKLAHLVSTAGAVVGVGSAIAVGTTAGLYLTGNFPTQGSPSGSVPAGNLYVSASGNDGTCARNDQSKPCLSLGRAYAIAACGDAVTILNGSYGGQVIASNPVLNGCSQRIVMTGQSQQGVVIDHIDSSGSNLTVKDVKLSKGMQIFTGANVTYNNIDGGAIAVGGGYGVSMSNVLISNSDWGPCDTRGIPFNGQPSLCNSDFYPDPAGVEGKNKVLDGANGVTFIHNYFHDFTRQGDDHFECVWVNGGRDITFDSNKFTNCNTNGVAMGNGGILFDTFDHCDTDAQGNQTCYSPPPEGTWYFQNNQCSDIENGDCVKFGQFSFRAFNGNFLFIIRYNTMNPGTGLLNEEGSNSGHIPPRDPIAGEVYMVGNIFGLSDLPLCIENGNYDYNIFEFFPGLANHIGCGNHAHYTTLLSDILVNTADLAAGGDYNLKGAPGSTVADNYVPPGILYGNLDHDYYGNPRPANTNYDAGMQER